METRRIITTLLLILFLLLGLVGLVVQLYYLNRGGPHFATPYVTGTWLSFSTIYLSTEGLLLSFKVQPPTCSDGKCSSSKWRLFFFSSLPILSLLLMIGYYVGYR